MDGRSHAGPLTASRVFETLASLSNITGEGEMFIELQPLAAFRIPYTQCLADLQPGILMSEAEA